MSALPDNLPELGAWLAYHQHNLGHSRETVANYRTLLSQHGEWLAGRRLNVQEVSPDLIQRYAGEVLHGRGMAANSRRVAVSALRGYYRWLLQRQVLRSNPAESLPYPKAARSLPVAIPLQDAERIMAACDLRSFKGVRDLAIIAVLTGCGPRISGVTGLNEGDLLFSLDEKGLERLDIRLREKGKQERWVPAPEDVRLLLRAYLGHPELDDIDRRLPTGDRVLFVNLRNSTVAAHEHRGEKRRLRKEAVCELLRELGARARVDRRYLHPHAFRHLFGQELAEADTPILQTQMLMGHADPKSSAIYGHIANRKLRETIEKANPLNRIRTPASGLAGVLRASRAG